MDWEVEPYNFNTYPKPRNYFLVEKGENTWIIPTTGPDRASYIHLVNPRSRGYSGLVLDFPLTNGTIFQAVAPWNCSADALKMSTGIDLTTEHLSLVVVGKSLKLAPRSNAVIQDVLYMDDEPKEGTYNRAELIALRILQQTGLSSVAIFSCSRGGYTLKTSTSKDLRRHLQTYRIRTSTR